MVKRDGIIAPTTVEEEVVKLKRLPAERPCAVPVLTTEGKRELGVVRERPLAARVKGALGKKPEVE